MKQLLFLSVLLLVTYLAFCQKGQKDKSLVAYFPFNGNATDLSSSKLTSKIMGAALTSDISGSPNGSYYFNGVNAYIEVQGGTAINLAEEFSISCWIAPESKGNFNSWISKANQFSQWRLGFGDVSVNEWGLGHWNQDRADHYTTMDTIPLNKWSHIVATFSKTTKMASIFFNGKLVESFEIAYGFLGSDMPLYIGYQKDDCSWFNGNIDEVRIFNRALDQNEIVKMYKEFDGKLVQPVFVKKSETYASTSGLPDYFGQIDPGNLAVRFAPEMFSTPNAENSTPAFSPDMKEVFWSVMRRSRDTIYQEIMVANKTGNQWSEPRRASFSDGKLFEGGPRFSPDGTKLFIFRGMPIFRFGVPANCKIICYAKQNNEWVDPQVITNGIYHAFTNEGTLYYNSLDFRTIRMPFVNGAYSKADTITQIAYQVGQNFQFCIAPDESYLIFTLRNSEVSDLYITFFDKTKNKWSIPKGIDLANSRAPEMASGLSPDGKYFFFIRRTPETNNDVFWLSSGFIEEMRKNIQWNKN